MEDLEIREYAKEDRNSCLDLLKKTFPNTSNEETFTWRFENNPVGKPLIIVAKQGDEVISFNSWIPWHFRHNGDMYIGYQSGESATDKRARGKGIFTEVLKQGTRIAKEMKVDFFFGYPSKMSYGVFYKNGYIPIATNYFHLMPISPLGRRLPKQVEKVETISLDSILWEKHKISPVISFDYLNWRYEMNTKNYKIIKYYENNCQTVFFLREKKWKGFNELILLDCQFDSYNEFIVDNAMDHLKKIYRRKAFFVRTFFNLESTRGKVLKKYFKIEAKKTDMILCVRPVSDSLDRNLFLNFNNWDIMPHCVDEL